MFKTETPKWLTREMVADAQAHAKREFPKEACGLITASRGYVPCENCAEDKINEFEINPTDYFNNRHDLLAVVHSHTNGNYAPGADDMRSQIATGCTWGILVATEDSASEPLWWGGDLPVAPLLGRQFIHGIHDCYSLIRDWYKLERGITLKDYPRDNNWWESGEALYSQFGDAGFYEVPNDPMTIQPGDVFLAKVRSAVENHGGLYVGGGLVMHHVGGHLSLTSPAGGWIRLVTRWVRYGVKP